MVKIFKEADKCTGCSACQQVCNKHAIVLKENEEGFLIPYIDEDMCVNCGKCYKVCPLVKKDDAISEKGKTAYAVKHINDDVRAKSASGAFFPAIAEYFLKSGGYVCGCVLENLIPIHIVSNKWEDVLRMQDSKYVQSDLKECFCEIKEILTVGGKVLFTGTSCQVEGLKSYLTLEHIHCENLLCIDFFCHGVPSPKIWREYLQFIERKKKKKVIGYRFRSKKYGWGKKSKGASYLNSTNLGGFGKETWDNISYVSRMWRMIFFSNLCIRPYCHKCKYATHNKPADITMGDFWGIESVLPEFDDGKGTSGIIVHNVKGMEFLRKVSALESREVSVKDVISKQANAFEPSKEGVKRKEFWIDYQIKGFDFVTKKYFGYTFSVRFRAFVKRILFAIGWRKLY